MRSVSLILLGLVALDHVHSLPPYWNTPSEEIDSTEHGVVPGRQGTTCRCGWANKNSARIIGGRETEVNEFPFAVILYAPAQSSIFCGGSIITSRHVLTAAHCATEFPNDQLAVIIGEHDYTTPWDTDSTNIVNVRERVIHENYRNSLNDIALLVLETNLQFTQTVGPVCMPHRQLDLVGQYVKAVGWGKMSATKEGNDHSPVLRKVNVRVLDLEHCRSFDPKFQVDLFRRQQLCTFSKYKGFGPMDSGGPIVWLNRDTNRFTLVGIPSFISIHTGSFNLDPDVSAAVSTYLNWILDKINETEPSANVCTAA